MFVRSTHASAARDTVSLRRPVQVWQLLMAVLGVAYLTEFIVQALSVYGLL